MRQVKEYIREIENKLCKFSGLKADAHDEFLGGYLNTKLRVLGVKVPLQRSVFRQGYSFSGLPFHEQLSLWNEIYHRAEVHEVKTQALYFVDTALKKESEEKIWLTIRGWVKSTDNWAHSDGLSSYYSRLQEKLDEKVLKQLQLWNRSDLLWERRQSVVSLLYYRRTRKKIPPYQVMLKLVENLLDDEEYYVQKGVGWTLRELWQVDAVRTEKFIEKNLNRITAVAFTAAAEKMPASKKEKLKAKRKSSRRQKLS